MRINLHVNERFCKDVVAKGFGKAHGVYTFKSAALEILTFAKTSGIKGVLEQISAPYSTWAGLIEEEKMRFPEWEPSESLGPAFELMSQRERTEWEFADTILCASEYVVESIGAQGGPVERCVVVPYGVDSRFEVVDRTFHKPLHVLTVGAVNLNKGAPYVLESAKRLKGKANFRMVGGIHVSKIAEQELRKHVELTGIVPRSEMAEHYRWADIFLFPSICEGFGAVLIEALSAGLPIIQTPNAGIVIRDGIDGYLAPIRNCDAIVEKIERLIDHPDLRRIMASNCIQRAKVFSLDAYKNRLLRYL
jgi:glycosyltransferase involved in cell wall biosynthesis